jgi:predicted DNA-binding transcriptional regulator AlpA
MDPRQPTRPVFITPNEFASIVRLSRRQIDRLRRQRPPGFPTEYELGSGTSKHGRCPRFKLEDVLAWMETRALW